MKEKFKTSRIMLLLLCAFFQDTIKAQNKLLDVVGKELKGTSGIVVFIAKTDINAAFSFAKQDKSYHVQVLLENYEAVSKARKSIEKDSVSGRLTIDTWDGKQLPYTSYLLNMIVVQDPNLNVKTEDIRRVLAPGGIALTSSKLNSWSIFKKSFPDEFDEWTHFLHNPNNDSVSTDSMVGPPKRLQWMGGPLWLRNHEMESGLPAMVIANGRIFYFYDDGPIGISDPRFPDKWSLKARDAFNGSLLWEVPLSHMGWREWLPELNNANWLAEGSHRFHVPVNIPRRLVAVNDSVYVTLGSREPITKLDAVSGKIFKTYEGTKHADEIIVDKGVIYSVIRPNPQKPDGKIIAISEVDGRIIWQKDAGRVVPVTMTVAEGKIAYLSEKNIVTLDCSTGKELWRYDEAEPASGRFYFSSDGMIVIIKNILLKASKKELIALSMDDGSLLWKRPGGPGIGVTMPPEIHVVKDTVWFVSTKGIDKLTQLTGWDLKTGEPKKTLDLGHLLTMGHHTRCYRSTATENYLLWVKRGVEFIDLSNKKHVRHNYIRSACRLGSFPGNGMLYATPSLCYCYEGTKLKGFNALIPRPMAQPFKENNNRLMEGPAHSKIANKQSNPETSDSDWPMYRRDSKRSGTTKTSVSSKLSIQWKIKLEGKISQAVVSGSKLYITRINAGQVCCFDMNSGKELWRINAGGIIDSAPSIYRGLLIFGSSDGYIYCCRTNDGELVWRFRAAPQDIRIAAFGRIASEWPAHGSVLILNDLVYCISGRASFLDGGLSIFALEPFTGKIKYRKNLIDPEQTHMIPDKGGAYDSSGVRSDILVSDGKNLFLYHHAFDSELNTLEVPRLSGNGERQFSRHLFATAGFLDTSGFHRSTWIHGKYWPGFYPAINSPKSGRILVFDNENTYAVKCFTLRNKISPLFFPGKDGYLVFADKNEAEILIVANKKSNDYFKWLPDIHEKITPWKIGLARQNPPLWKKYMPVRFNSMVKADTKLFMAGSPDIVPKDDPLAALEDRKGAILKILDAETGKELGEYQFEVPPVFDGMIAAHKSLLISFKDGSVIRMK